MATLSDRTMRVRAEQHNFLVFRITGFRVICYKRSFFPFPPESSALHPIVVLHPTPVAQLQLVLFSTGIPRPARLPLQSSL